MKSESPVNLRKQYNIKIIFKTGECFILNSILLISTGRFKDVYEYIPESASKPTANKTMCSKFSSPLYFCM